MDMKKLSALARKQRAAEESELNTSSNINEHTNIENAAQYDEAIYIPLEDDVDDLPDDGYSAASSFIEESGGIEEPKKEMPDELQEESLEDIIKKCFPDEKAYNIELERLLPFRSRLFFQDGNLTELKSDVARKGITEPLLVRSAGNGEYEILSGNRRRAAAEQLMWTKVPCRIGSNDLITDEYARRIVAESNCDRFSSLSLSEKIRISSVLKDRAEAELHLSHEQIILYSQLNSLCDNFLIMLDNSEISMATAEMLAELSSETQSSVLNVLKQHPEMKITAANAKELHDESNLTTAAITKILKPKPPVKIAVPAEIVSEYLSGKTAEQLTEIVSAAIRRYCKEENHVEI